MRHVSLSQTIVSSSSRMCDTSSNKKCKARDADPHTKLTLVRPVAMVNAYILRGDWRISAYFRFPHPPHIRTDPRLVSLFVSLHVVCEQKLFECAYEITLFRWKISLLAFPPVCLSIRPIPHSSKLHRLHAISVQQTKKLT